MESLNDLLVEELKDLYSAEKQIVKALPKMVKGAQSQELKSALSEHLEVTKQQVTRLEEVFSHLEQKAKAKHCKGMEGLLAEGAEALEESEASPLRDLQIIGAAQRVEHYEVAAYGTARAIAEHLELSEVVDLLTQTFDEEEEADQKLTEVAEGLYGEVSAAGEDMEEEEGEEDIETAKPAASAGSKRKAVAAASRR
jgi:ferritin-like metal-binding protein YciE